MENQAVENFEEGEVLPEVEAVPEELAEPQGKRLDELSRDQLKELADKKHMDYGKTWGKAVFVEKLTAHLESEYVPEEPKGAKPDFVETVAPPPKAAAVEELEAALVQYKAKGLQIVHIDNDTWQFRFGNREDSGTMHQPLRRILQCAAMLLRAEIRPDLGE